MEGFLKTEGNKIVDSKSNTVILRGVGVGGWMNMENFINGFPGTEHDLREIAANQLGRSGAKFFFDKMADYFFTEKDIVFLKSLGINSIRIPINYRHFEDDQKPYVYNNEGFQRLKQAVAWCKKHSIYAVLDLHAAPGGQNPDWHCDNSSGIAYLWDHPHFQNRLLGLWNTIAREFKDEEAVAGYEILNEPSTLRFGGFKWKNLNNLNKKVVSEIRKIDPNHIIILEGDFFTNKYSGLEEPFTNNLVYATHNYHPSGFGPGPYPGKIGKIFWDQDKQKEKFEGEEGTKFAKKYNVPLMSGEFGSVYNGPPMEIPDRLRSLDDQLSIMEELKVSWNLWTYKDVGVMGLVTLDPQSDYMKIIKPILDAKIELGADPWMHWLPMTVSKHKIKEYGFLLKKRLKETEGVYDFLKNSVAMATGAVLQKDFVSLFENFPQEKIDDILRSFSLENCIINEGFADVIKKHCISLFFQPNPAIISPHERTNLYIHR